MFRLSGPLVILALACACSADRADPPAVPPSSPAGGSAGTGGASGAAGSGGAPSDVGRGGTSSAGAGGSPSSSGAGGGGGEPASDHALLSDCALSFPYRNEPERGNWLGADSNFSVVLSPTRALMTFQDTFVGGSDLTSRSGTVFVANTVAEITCEDGAYSIEYFWWRDDDAHRAIFVDTHPSGDRLWIHRPWLHEGKLFLTATRVGEGGELGFEEHGMTLARVEDPLAAPSEWSIEYFNLTEQRATVGKGVALHGEHVYLFTPVDNDVVLARLHRDRLLEPTIAESSLEYLTGDDTWLPGLDLGSAKKLGLTANTGLTVRYHEASAQWLALFLTTDHWPSAEIVVSSAPSLEGPWSAPELIYEIPEMTPAAPEYDPDTFCYGAAEHEAFNPDPDARLLFTYTCNSAVFEKQVENLGIYVPVVVDVDSPLAD